MNSLTTADKSTQMMNASTQRKGKGILALLASIALILVFMFVIGPMVAQLPMIKPLADFIEERQIDAGALYYTEIEEFSEAELNLRHTMEYGPKDNRP